MTRLFYYFLFSVILFSGAEGRSAGWLETLIASTLRPSQRVSSSPKHQRCNSLAKDIADRCTRKGMQKKSLKKRPPHLNTVQCDAKQFTAGTRRQHGGSEQRVFAAGAPAARNQRPGPVAALPYLLGRRDRAAPPAQRALMSSVSLLSFVSTGTNTVRKIIEELEQSWKWRRTTVCEGGEGGG